MSAAASSIASSSSGRVGHAVPRPQPHAARRSRGRGRAGARDRAVRRAGGLHPRPNRALAAQLLVQRAIRPAREGFPHLRPRLHASRRVSQARTAGRAPAPQQASRPAARPSLDDAERTGRRSRSRCGCRSGGRTPSRSRSPLLACCADRDLLLPERAGAAAARLRVGPARVSRLHAGLARLVCERAAVRRQRR